MSSQPIVTSLLDTDLYKFSMLQAAWNQYPEARVTYAFTCRTPLISVTKSGEPKYTLSQLVDISELHRQIEFLKEIPLQPDEAEYLVGLDYMKESFLSDVVNTCPMQKVFVKAIVLPDGNISIKISGYWWEAILYEVPVLAIISELAMNSLRKIAGQDMYLETARVGLAKLNDKIKLLREFPGVKFADFGTRRRYSKAWHDTVVGTLQARCKNCIGTSNLWLARKYGMKPIGTVAHEWTMAHLGLVDRPRQAQGRALHVWQQEFGSRLGIALTDTFTTDAFFQDFDFPLARAYDGIRHDSGCPHVFTEKAIAHYESVGIDPKRKTIIYSDGLDFPKMIEIWKRYAGEVGIAFGIGTNLTNDVGLTPMNIVIKLTQCNGKPCIKLSDVPGKEMGDPGMIQMVKDVYKIER